MECGDLGIKVKKWESMGKYMIKRILQSGIVLLVMSIFAFALINAAPGNPAAAIYGGQMDRLTQEERDRINTNLGLDQPLFTRYCNWVGEVVNGRLGNSYANGRSVNAILSERLPNTLLLFSVSFVMTVLLAIVLGLWAGLHPNSALDRGVTVAGIVVNGVSSVLVAIGLIVVFSVQLGWLPTSGTGSIFSGGAADRMRHLLLPVATIVLSHVGSFARFIQEGIKEEQTSYYVTVARANQVAPVYLYCGMMKNALVPFINYAGTHVPSFFSGFVVVEAVFAYPGLGNMIVGAISVKDYPVLMGGILVIGLVVILSMLAVDLIDLALNPKLRKSVVE